MRQKKPMSYSLRQKIFISGGRPGYIYEYMISRVLPIRQAGAFCTTRTPFSLPRALQGSTDMIVNGLRGFGIRTQNIPVCSAAAYIRSEPVKARG